MGWAQTGHTGRLAAVTQAQAGPAPWGSFPLDMLMLCKGTSPPVTLDQGDRFLGLGLGHPDRLPQPVAPRKLSAHTGCPALAEFMQGAKRDPAVPFSI